MACATLFLLFTSQRSGSTWTCQVLDSQSGVTCGVPNPRSPTSTTSEMMIGYSRRYPGDGVSWDAWRADAERAFDALRRAAPAASTACGFKLMRDQVPRALVPRFLDWLAARRIRVAHLVREASILRLASHVAAEGSIHSNDPARVAETRRGAKMRWRAAGAVAAAVRDIERGNDWWHERLQFHPRLVYHYVAYESLVGDGAAAYAADVVRFLGPRAAADPFALVDGGLLALHERACADRVERFDALAPFLNGTRCEAACAQLANRSLPGLPPPEHREGRCNICV